MNPFDDVVLAVRSFSYREIFGQDRWKQFTPVFVSLTVVGDTTYKGRLRVVGKQCQFQVQFQAVTSIASTAGTTYLELPITAVGIGGVATMTNDTTNIAVGVAHICETLQGCFLPTQGASADVFMLCGWYEI